MRLGVDARVGEKVLILTDGTGQADFVPSLMRHFVLVGAAPAVLTIPPVSAQPHGYLTWREPPAIVQLALDDADVAVVYMCTLIALSRTVQEARASGTRFLFVPADYNLGGPATLDEDLQELAALGAMIHKRLGAASSAHVTAAEGTDIQFGSLLSPSFDDARSCFPGDIDFFPGGMWNVIPRPSTVDGVVVFPATLYPVSTLVEPVTITFEGGTITSIKGGWQARAWERWLRSFADVRLFEFSHLSGGLAKRARIIGHDWEDLIHRGGILISGGENVLYGGQNTAHAHFDGVVPDATLALDGDTVLEEGAYLAGTPDTTRGDELRPAEVATPE